MIKHVLRLIWNRKKRNFLLLTEIFFAFVVLFAVASMTISIVVQYIKPIGFSHEDVWVLHVDWRSHENEMSEQEMRGQLKQIQLETEAFEETIDFSWVSFNYPYSRAICRTILDFDGQKIGAEIFEADDKFAEVMELDILEGRWFSREDDASSRRPVVLNRQMKEELFGDEPAVGYVHSDDDDEYIVVGVIGEYRYRGEFEEYGNGFFQRSVLSDTASHLPEVALFSVRPGTGVQFEERLVRHLSPVAGSMVIRVETMSSTRSEYLQEAFMRTGLPAVVACFLILNVALGLFGVLWYSISRRRGEIGLRRAVGANSWHISWQILGEALVLATFAIAGGIVIAVQVPILGLEQRVGSVIYVFAMACSVIIIYLIVSLCALYPSWLASKIQPATALHDE